MLQHPAVVAADITVLTDVMILLLFLLMLLVMIM
jgi:hypothetical protein